MTAGSIKLDNPYGTSRMIRSAASKRMIWKEFRQNVPLLVIFVAVLILTLAISTYAQAPAQAAKDTTFWFPLIWSFNNVFALTIGVFLFAPEKENRTSHMLSQLPVTSGFVVRSKLWVGAATVLMFVAIGVLLQLFEMFALGHRFEWPQWYQNISSAFEILGWVVVAFVVPIEFFCLGALCSLFIKRTIFAVVVATGAFIFSWILPPLISSFIPTTFSSQQWTDWFLVTEFVTIKCLIFLAVFAGLVYGGRRWLGNSPQIVSSSRTSRSKSVAVTHADALPIESRTRPTRGRIYSSLIWQSFRQYRFVFLLAIGISVPLAFILSTLLAINLIRGQGGTAIFFSIVQFLIVLIGALFSFSIDHQDRNYRFFQQHVEHGRKLWLARLTPPAILAMICSFVLVFSILGVELVRPYLMRGDETVLRTVSVAVLSIFAAFAVGQFCSMFFRSSVFAFLAVLVMVWLGGVWVVWLVYLNSLPWLFFAPILLGMLGITWWRAPAWLADRNQVAQRALPWLALVLVTASTVSAFIAHRIVSVPDVGLSMKQLQTSYVASAGQPDREGVRKRSQLLRDASEMIRLNPGEVRGGPADRSPRLAPAMPLPYQPRIKWFSADDSEIRQQLGEFLRTNQEPLDLIHQANSVDAWIEILETDSIARREELSTNLRLLMAAEARQAEFDGDLEHALELWLQLKRFEDEYPVFSGVPPRAEILIARWSELPGQSPELIKKAIKALVNDSDDWNRRRNRVLVLDQLDFANWLEEWSDGNPDPARGPSGGVSVANWPVQLMPWEVERSRRISNLRIMFSVRGDFYFREFATKDETSFATIGGSDYPAALVRISERWQTNLDRSLFEVGFNGSWLEAYHVLQEIQTQRYLRVRMALRAWQLEHGDLPESLEQLVPTYFKELPIDVFYGRNFFYAPNGRDAQVGWNISIPTNPSIFGAIRLFKHKVDELIPANMPFLLPWSTFYATSQHQYTSSDTSAYGRFYEFSDPSKFLCQYPFYDKYQLNWDDRNSPENATGD